MTQEEFNELVDKLIVLGEEKAEMELWSKIFQDLDLSEQQALIINLETELQKLKQLNKTENKHARRF